MPTFLDSSHVKLTVMTIAWLGVVGIGMVLLCQHENQPGVLAAAPRTWPSDSQLVRFANGPTLVVFVHPQCPCTRTTLGELEVLVAQSSTPISTYVVFLHPAGMHDRWYQTASWTNAKRIPGATRFVDAAGQETERFGAETSGQVILYDRHGSLVFQGGITRSRGHSGDNTGRDAILSHVADEPVGTSVRRGFVFGCPLNDPECERPNQEAIRCPPM